MMEVPQYGDDIPVESAPEGKNSFVLNVEYIGTAYSKFSHAKVIFCWELTASEIQRALKIGSALSVVVKQVELSTDELFRAQFTLQLRPGDAFVKALILREADFKKTFRIIL